MVEPTTVLAFLTVGAVLGAAGQGIRAVVGLKKGRDHCARTGTAWEDWFELRELVTSLLVGAIAGVLGALLLAFRLGLNDLQGIDAKQWEDALLGLLAAGYAGTDFIEGVVDARGLKADEG